MGSVAFHSLDVSSACLEILFCHEIGAPNLKLAFIWRQKIHDVVESPGEIDDRYLGCFKQAPGELKI